MKYDTENCGACIRAALAEQGIGCISLGSAISGFLTGKDAHDPSCRADKPSSPSPSTDEES